MKKIFLLFILGIAFHTTGTSQTYPLDSCLNFMTPTDFLIKKINIIGSGNQEQVIIFRSSGSSNPGMSFTGKGYLVFEPNDLPIGLEPKTRMTGNMVLTTHGSDPHPSGIPGTTFNYPDVLSGYLDQLGGQTINPSIPVTVQVIEFEYTEY